MLFDGRYPHDNQGTLAKATSLNQSSDGVCHRQISTHSLHAMPPLVQFRELQMVVGCQLGVHSRRQYALPTTICDRFQAAAFARYRLYTMNVVQCRHLDTISKMTINNLDDDKVIPFLVWVRDFSGLSEPTARRICKPGCGGPRLIRLSTRRLGVRVGDHREWMKRRTLDP